MHGERPNTKVSLKKRLAAVAPVLLENMHILFSVKKLTGLNEHPLCELCHAKSEFSIPHTHPTPQLNKRVSLYTIALPES